MTRITIGMPVYNGAATMAAALDSLLAQTFQDFVIVISENCSSDETETICRAYAERDARISYVKQPVHLSPSLNFRFVLFEARTPYFMWAAADDLWAPGFVAANMAALERDPKAVASQSRVMFTVLGVASHLATGTYALTEDTRRNAARFFGYPADNTRIYSVFRTPALQAVYPSRHFHGFDWAISAASLRFGTHIELPDVLMSRDFTPTDSYERWVSKDHTFFLWRMFPVLFMTKWLLGRRQVPISIALLYNLAKLNLYMHFRFGSYRWRRLSRWYLSPNSVRAAGHAMEAMILRQSESAKRWTFRQLNRRAATPSPLDARTSGVVPGPAVLSRDQALPTGAWRWPHKLPAHPPAAAVIMVVHDDLLSTLAQIDSLEASTGEHSLEVIVVDTGSTDVTAFLGRICPRVIHVRMAATVSYGEAAMAGAAAATADRLIFAGQGPLADSNSVTKLLASLDVAEAAVSRSNHPDTQLGTAGLEVRSAPAPRGTASAPDIVDASDDDSRDAWIAVRREVLNSMHDLPRDRESFKMTLLETADRVRARNGLECR